MMRSVAHTEQQHYRAVKFGTPSKASCGRLQGIALSADPNYKVLGSAYPWIARRLLSDNSPDLQETLRALLYKGNKFQFARLESLLRQAVKSPPRTSVDSSTRPNSRVSPGVVFCSCTLQLLAYPIKENAHCRFTSYRSLLCSKLSRFRHAPVIDSSTCPIREPLQVKGPAAAL